MSDLGNAATSELTARVRSTLADLSDPEKAAPMQAYMKSEMPFRGVQAPIRRKTCNQIFSSNRLGSKSEWRDAVLDLWRNAAFREERYAAIDLAGFRFYDEYQQPDLLSIYEEMIVVGAWWDFVDEVSVRRVGLLLRRYPVDLRPHMIDWSKGPDMWRRRASIISQLKFKADTDFDLLRACIEPSIRDREFFLRKAIGWALREYAKTDANAVRRYVASNEERLSGLSRREALRNLPGGE